MTLGPRPAYLRDLSLAWRGDFSDRELLEGNRLRMTDDELRRLDDFADRFWEEVLHIGVFQRGGQPAVPELGSRVVQWTAASRLFAVGGRRIFVLCNYPASWGVRLYFMARSFAYGVPLRRHVGGGWKRRIESHSIVPTFVWNRRGMVAMPFIEAAVASDVIRTTEGKRHPNPAFEWISGMTSEDGLALITDIAALLGRLHRCGITWGEPNLENVLINPKREPMFIDAETEYLGIGPERQKRFDINRLIWSAKNVLPAQTEQAERAVRDGYARDGG